MSITPGEGSQGPPAWDGEDSASLWCLPWSVCLSIRPQKALFWQCWLSLVGAAIPSPLDPLQRVWEGACILTPASPQFLGQR